ncbi:MAG TPA: hypothetical protein VFX45_07880 [Solirubrobacterales bacterium]|nr:hypothetical protein [Solirubrobacterales bacterium]
MKRSLLPLTAVAFLLASTASAAAAVSKAEAERAADRDPVVVEQRRENGGLTSSADLDEGKWEVAYFAGGKEVALAIVDRESGEVEESWAGYQVAWRMARGYEGQFGHKLNAPYVFLPLCAIFLLGLVDWRRWRRVATLDLVVLLGFGVSHYFFNQGEIGVSVPLQYPVLLYLFGRALWIGWRGRGEGLSPVWPARWLLIAALFLMGFRVGLNLADSGAIDVGYASVVGADRISHGEPIYGSFPDDVSSGDTYGPLNYLAYVPFELVWPWAGSWDDLPAAHGAAVSFDLLAFGFLILLGLRIRPGPAGCRLAAVLAFGWAAYPYSAFALESNTNDTLVAVLLLATLLVLAKPLARGALAAAATWAKFAPAILVPMLFTYESRKRPMLLFAGGFAAVSAAALIWPLLDPGLSTFYDRTIDYQANRNSPFSIWGQVSLDPLRTVLVAATAALSLLLAFRPHRKSLVQVAALGAALLLAVQITMDHWFYLYIVWFYPLLLIALASLEAGPSPSPTSSGEGEVKSQYGAEAR